MRIEAGSKLKYISEICHSLKIPHSLHLINAKFDDFLNFKTTFRKNFLVPGEQTPETYAVDFI